jgi:nucleoside-diphosphate-sugar epimerase
MTLTDSDVTGRLTGAGAAALKSGDQRIVVVGAGGWLGLATLELLHRLLGPRAFAARVAAFGSSARVLQLRDGLTVTQRPLSDLASLPRAPSLVLHLAFLTQEKAKAISEEAYVAANRAISAEVLDALDQIGAEGVFVPSSGAVYMVNDPGAQASMRLYGRLKLEDEATFSEWAEARGRRAVIARVFNLSGPYINKQSSYALACFINDALARRPIEIKATRPVYRSFVAISELMSVVLGALTGAAPKGVALFDTAGDEVLEMGDIADFVRHVLEASADIRRQALDSSIPDRYVGDGATYRNLRAQAGVSTVDFPRQIKTTAAYMSGCSSEGSRVTFFPETRSA